MRHRSRSTLAHIMAFCLLDRWRYQAITWTNIDWPSMRSCGIYLRASSFEMLKLFFLDMSVKIIILKVQTRLPGTNELTTWLLKWLIAILTYLATVYRCACVLGRQNRMNKISNFKSRFGKLCKGLLTSFLGCKLWNHIFHHSYNKLYNTSYFQSVQLSETYI